MTVGTWLVIHEAYAARPDDAILVVAMALLVPSAAVHVKGLLSGPGGGQSSPPGPGSESQPSSRPPADSGDRAAAGGP